MTVQDLIHQLEKMPLDAKVIVVDPKLYGSNIVEVCINDDDLGKDKVKIYIS